MDKQQARENIRETFESCFDKSRFIGFIKNLFNRIDEATSFPPRQGSYIPESYRDFVSKYERIGKYHDGENRIDILIVYLKRQTSIERARTNQRNFIAGYLQGKYGSTPEKEAALVAYVSPNEADWRFSLVKMDYRFEKSKTGKMKVREEFTPARRWSFLVGESENSHTAQSRLVNILADDERSPTLEELENGFDIETVTKEFFLKYRELFLRVKEELDRVVKNDPKIEADFNAKGVDTVNFAKKLLGQIIFLYFLQKKGWFGAGRDDDWGKGSKHFLRELFKKKHGDYNNFFDNILEPLFYEALRIDRTNDDYYSRFNCKIPFLNGGLFDPIGNYDWVHTDINLPDTLFSNTRKTREGDIGDGILDVFDRYNFTVREDEPLEKEVAIDPELLGKVYEKFNAIRPDNFDEFQKALKSGRRGEENKFNKKFGVYYTPREIVHYMCKQSLINYLHTRADEAKLPSSIKKTDIEDLIEVGELISEHEAMALIKQEKIKNGIQKSSEYTQLLSDCVRENAKALDEWLADITVCDPAVGSGAFPVGMMNEIVRARNVLSVFLNDGTGNEYEFKRRCIEHSLYGVDIDPGAVEIAKLRLWLSLMVDEEDIKNIKPLPNLDYRIMQGNSLISEFMGINFDDDENKYLKERISALAIEEKKINKKIKEKEKEQLRFYNKHHKEDKALSKELDVLAKDKNKIKNKISKNKAGIEKNDRNSAELAEALKKFKQKKDEFLNESNVSQKKKLKEEIDNLLVDIFETRLKTQKIDFFNRLKDIENKYSVLSNETQKKELINQEKQKLYKDSGFDLETAENQLKEFSSGRQVKPFFLWNLYFSEVFHGKDGFDVVIANPPYVGEKGNKEIFRTIKKSSICRFYKSKMDLFYFFFHQSINLTKLKGHICFITTNYFITADSAIKLRSDFNRRSKPITLVNFNEFKIFDSALGQHNIITLLNKTAHNTQKTLIADCKRKNETGSVILENILIGIDEKTKYFEVANVFEGQNNYIRLSDSKGDMINILNKIKLNNRLLGNLFNINAGCDVTISKIKPKHISDFNIQATKNEGVFVLHKSEVNSLNLNTYETSLIKDFVKNSGLKKYTVKLSSDKLIYTNWQTDENDIPNIIRHLNKYKVILDDQKERYNEPSWPWYSLHRPRDISIFNSSKKILVPYRSKTNTFAYYENPVFSSRDVFFITHNHQTNIDIKYLLAILNSSIMFIWLFYRGKRKGETLELYQTPLSEIPVKEIDKEAQHPFIDLVDKILAITKNADYQENPAKQAQVKEYENQINQFVYQLYDLTDKEIKIVEGGTK